MHVRLIPHSPSGPRHLLAHYPLVSCIRALLAIYTDARAYRPSASLLAFLAGRVWTRHGSSTIAPPAFLYCWALPAGRATRDARHTTCPVHLSDALTVALTALAFAPTVLAHE